MVDFRYHLVSLVSVFLALAVGIVLGAGPLQDSIGNTLSDQVSSLRQSRDEARAAAEAAQNELQYTDAQIDAAGTQLVADTLRNRTVAVVRLPGADDSYASAISEVIEDAGGTVTSTVTLTDKYANAETATYRKALAGTLAGYTGTSADADPEDVLGASLSYMLRTGAQDPNAAIVRDTLTNSENELIKISGSVDAPVHAVVVLGPDTFVVTSSDKQETEKPFDPSPAYLSLVESLASGGATVIAGPGVDNNSAIGVLRGANVGSSVDSLEMTAGTYNVAIAVASEITGQHVKLGTDGGAAAFGTRVDASEG